MAKQDTFASWVSADWVDDVDVFIGHTRNASPQHIKPNATGTDSLCIRTDAWDNVQSSQVTLAETGSENGWCAACVLMKTDGSGFIGTTDCSGTDYYIYELPAWTVRVNATGTKLVVGDTLKLSRDSSNVLRLYRNGSQVLNWTRASGNSTGTPGISMFKAAAGPEDIGVSQWDGTGEALTPSTATLAITTYAPTVTASGGGGASVTPTTAALTLTTFAPTVLTPSLCTPGIIALVLATFAPMVLTPALVTPSTATLSTTTYAPSIITPVLVTPDIAALTLSGFAPSVLTPSLVTPDTLALTTAAFAPTVSLSDNALVTPDTATLALTTYAPAVTAPLTITPGIAELVLVGFAPSVSVGADVNLVPGVGTLTLTTFAPDVLTPQLFTPSTASLVLTGFAPTVGLTALPFSIVQPYIVVYVWRRTA